MNKKIKSADEEKYLTTRNLKNRESITKQYEFFFR